QARHCLSVRRSRPLSRRLVRRARARRGCARRHRLGRGARLRLGGPPPRAGAGRGVHGDDCPAADLGRLPRPGAGARRGAAHARCRRGEGPRREFLHRGRAARDDPDRAGRRGRDSVRRAVPDPRQSSPTAGMAARVPDRGRAGRRGRPRGGVRQLARVERERPKAAPDLRLVADPDDRPGASRLVRDEHRQPGDRALRRGGPPRAGRPACGDRRGDRRLGGPAPPPIGRHIGDYRRGPRRTL
ncbi:MAG: FIG00986747: hypothetical protein, partial [uncultured Thermomicrobiales bacterium]